MGFDRPTMWMRNGYATEPVIVRSERSRTGLRVEHAGMELLASGRAISAPPRQSVASSFEVAVMAGAPGTPLQLQVRFCGSPALWYASFALRHQLRVPVGCEGVAEELSALVQLDADPPQMLWGNPVLHPLSLDGRFGFFADADLEFHSLDLQQPLPLDANGGLALAQGARLPSELARRPFRVEIRARDERSRERVVHGVVPFQLHAGTDLIAMFDRSRSMKQRDTSTQTTRWAAVREAASLLAEIYGGALSPLRTPAGGRLLDEQRIAFGHFDVRERCPRTIIAPLRAASGDKPRLAEEAGSGGAALGDALITAQQFFGENACPRRRHIVVLTASMDAGQARPLGELGPASLPRSDDDPERGVIIHHVAYGRAGETPSADLCALSRAYGGEFHDSASEPDPLDPDALNAMFLSVLAGVLPIERIELRGSGPVMLEDGTRRAIFVARNAADLRVSHGGRELPEAARRTTAAFTFVTVDQPEPGEWQVRVSSDAPVTVLLEAALRMRCGLSARGLGEPIGVWAELAHGIEPVRGAELQASAALPDESLGALLTAFAQSGTRRAGDGDHAGDAVDAAAQRALLDVVERVRDRPFRTRRTALSWVEVRPGRYEAELPGADAQHEGTYGFRIRARGRTPDGHAFERAARAATVLAPIPDPQHTACWIEERERSLPHGPRSWLATFQPRTRLGTPLGPGLAHDLRVQVGDEQGERSERLRAIDNLDGTYSVRCESGNGGPCPALALHYRLAGVAEALAVIPLRHEGRGGRRVRVLLNALRIGDPRDRCLRRDPDASPDAGPRLELDAIVAINGNAGRALRKRVTKALPARFDSRVEIELSEVLFDRQVEPGAALDITLGEPDFAWLAPRHHQVYRLHEHGPATRAVLLASTGEPHWEVSLSVQVETAD